MYRVGAARTLFAAGLCLFLCDARADLATAILECDALADGEQDRLSAFVADDCSPVVREIEAGVWKSSLGPEWRSELSFWELSELAFFDDYYHTRVRQGPEISTESLDVIVSSLATAPQPAEDLSAWDRFVRWLRDILASDSPEDDGWLSRWLSGVEVPSSLLEITFWTLCVLVVAGAVSVVVVEVRAARRGAGDRRGAGKRAGTMPFAPAGYRDLTLEDVENASLMDRPSILVRLFLQRLEILGLISGGKARTHRQAAEIVGGLGIIDDDVFSRVSKSAEKIRFGGTGCEAGEIGDVVTEGILLARKLDRRSA